MGSRALLLIGLGLCVQSVGAETVTFADLCARGDSRSCEIAAVQARIDFSQFDPETGKYKWLMEPLDIGPVGDTAKDRAWFRANTYCVLHEKAYLGPNVATFSRLTGDVAVHRVAYDSCMVGATKNFLRQEREEQVSKVLRIMAIVAAVLLGLAALWYRRPLVRKTRDLLGRLNKIGPQ